MAERAPRTSPTVCGIAGYSLSGASAVDRTLAAQALLAGIAERGADAVGYAYRCGGGPIVVHKQQSGASALLGRLEIPPEATEVLVHVRDYTKGHPTIAENNHPIRHGAVVGIHNGVVENDDALFAEFGFERAHPRMTVDSEVIFALVEHSQGRARVLERCRGAIATAWLDERRPGRLFLARGVGRPLWVGRGRHELLFASTSAALEVAERYVHLPLRKRELDEGTLLVVRGGRDDGRERFRPDASYAETPLPAVRAPDEGSSCLSLLASLFAA